MNEREITIHIKVSRRTFVWAAAVLLMCCAANEVVSESITMTTYYPAPSGTYQRLVTTGGSSANPGNTILARDAGSVGIGTTNPGAELDVNGTARVTGFQMPTGASNGYVLTSDAAGNAAWQAAPLSCSTLSQGGVGTVSCPPGYQATGGGIDFAGMGDHGGYVSSPANPPSGWSCNYDNADGGTSTEQVVTCYVVCCK